MWNPIVARIRPPVTTMRLTPIIAIVAIICSRDSAILRRAAGISVPSIVSSSRLETESARLRPDWKSGSGGGSPSPSIATARPASSRRLCG